MTYPETSSDLERRVRGLRRRLVVERAVFGITLLLAIVVLSFILLAVVPQFEAAYAATNIKRLPGYTQFVLSASQFLLCRW